MLANGVIRALLLVALLWTCAPLEIVEAQVPDCTGDDPAGARAALSAGTALLQRAIADAREGGDRARAIAAEALAHFDRQCRLGDPSALMQRGAALMLMGEPLRSAQSYDAFLRVRPLRTLDARTRRIVESNLQLGEAIVEIDRGSGMLFVDGADFGPLPRGAVLHLPVGEHLFEARDEDGVVLDRVAVTLTSGGGPAGVRLTLERTAPEEEQRPDPPSDLRRWYLVTVGATVVSLAIGFVFLAVRSERQSAYDEVCVDPPGPTEGCGAVLTERDAAFLTSIAGFVLAGIAGVSVGVVVAIDLGQPSASNGASLTLSHRF
jgi:hypothetical protein